MPKILVVDDENNIQELLRYTFEREGYIVLTAPGGREAYNTACAQKPDLIILDIMLPEMDGYEVCRMLKSNRETAGIPIIMLSARREEMDKVVGLELGAEDYVTKPFSPREMVARVKVNLRRKNQLLNEVPVESGSEIVVGELVVIPDKYRATLRGTRLDLTPKEFNVLRLLASNVGIVFTREKLLELVWGTEQLVETRTVDVHIRYLRQKIERNPASPEYIETVRGVGYRMREQK